MRDIWPRQRPLIDLGRDAVATLVRRAIADARIADVTPLPGGLRNTNLGVTLDVPPRCVVLRLYQGELAQARNEVALTRAVAGRVPVAEVLHFAETNTVTGHAFAVEEFIDAQRLDEIALAIDDAALGELAAAVGATLARIHAVRFAHHGFLEVGMLKPEPIDLGTSGLRRYLHEQLVTGAGGARLGAGLTEAVLDFANNAGALLESWASPPSLVHGDFNPSNILVRHGAGWEVAAVLDWEYALSGLPAMDFGALMRSPLGDRPAFGDGLARGYRDAGGALPPEWRRLAGVADLFSWADMLGRPAVAPAVVADARTAMRRVLDPEGDG